MSDLSDNMLAALKHLRVVARLHAGNADEADDLVERALRHAIECKGAMPEDEGLIGWLEDFLLKSMQ